MTPIKSLGMIKRSLEKAFMCKSHFMIMIHSEWCLLLSTCLLWNEPAIYFWVRRGAGGEGGGGGGWYTRKHGNTFMQVSPICGICIMGMLDRKFSYF